MTRRWASDGIVQPETGAPLQRISMPSAVPLRDQCDRAWRGVRTGSRKLVLAEGGIPWLCFDLERDPGELVNLRDDPTMADEMEALRRAV
jgi:hypothetical protein